MKHSLKKLISLLLVLSMALVLPVTGLSDDVKVTAISMLPSSMTLDVGEDKKIAAIVAPDDATDKTVTFTSSNTAYATVNGSGTVTGVKAGSVTITATANDGSGVTGTTNVTIKQPATAVSLSQSSATMNVGDTLTLTAGVSPDDTTDKSVSWSSSSSAVATVADGVVTAVSKGTATITVTTNDGSSKTATCSITVKQPVTGITLSDSEVSLTVGGTKQLTATVVPSDASESGVTWASTNPSVATVSASGLVTAVGAGAATVTAAADDGSGKTATCSVVVKQMVTGITLDHTTLSLREGTGASLVATVEPATASNPAVTFTSLNPEVATVTSVGVVSAVKAGTATIRCEAADGSGVYATCTVTVLKGVTGITVEPTSFTIGVGEEKMLNVDVTPVDAANQGVTFTSSNTAVAVVSKEGRVTGVSLGSAVITAKSNDDPNVLAACNVTVGMMIDSISIVPSAITLETGKTYVLAATVQPAGATNTNLKWTSGSPAVASVNESTGVVQTWSAGTAVITAAAQDGSGKTGTCTITVTGGTVTPTKVSKVTLNEEAITVAAGGTAQLTATVEPYDAADKSVKWTSSKTSVATVDENGLITAVAAGSATITCASNDGGASATCTVTVVQSVTGITVTPTSAVVTPGGTISLAVSVSPSDASNKNVGYQSSNNAVAVVSNTGVVTGVAPGTAVITVFSADNTSIRATCTITVGKAVTGVSVSPSAISLTTGTSYELTAVVQPDDATNPAVTWSSSDKTMAQVNNAGVVTLYKAGTVTITATAADGSGYFGTCVFTVTGGTIDAPTEPPTPITPVPGPTNVPIGGQTARVNTVKGSLNLRQQPKDGSKILTRIPENGYFTVLTKGTEWCYSYYDGYYGYVMTKFVSFDLTPVVTTPVPDTGYTAYVDTVDGGLNIRSSASTSAKRLGVIPKGAEFLVLTYGSTWCYVKYNGITGYAMTKFIKLGSPTSTPTPTKQTVVAYGYVTTVSGGLNQRPTKSMSSSVIQVIPRNTWVNILEKGETWCYVSYNGKDGWVMTKFLTISNSKENTPKPTTTSTSGSYQTAWVAVATGTTLNQRSSASTNASIITRIPNGAAVQVYSKGSTWSYIKYNGKYGYVMTQFLQF